MTSAAQDTAERRNDISAPKDNPGKMRATAAQQKTVCGACYSLSYPG
ncbi:hypothetical protein [Mycobacterium gastri]|nr:hypothetical protein [Mycobacterium gastri]